MNKQQITEIDYQSALTQMSQQFDALKKRWGRE